jgi:hypothetical protein
MALSQDARQGLAERKVDIAKWLWRGIPKKYWTGNRQADMERRQLSE